MHSTKKLLIILSFLVVSGCATPYQPIGNSGGYFHNKVTDSVYRVSFHGNGDTNYKRAYDFALLRSAELCDQLSFTYFVVDGQSDSTVNTYVYSGSSGSLWPYPVQIPKLTLTVRYFENMPSGKHLEIFNATEVIGRLKKKYRL